METKLPEIKWRCLKHDFVRVSGEVCPKCEEHRATNVTKGNIYEHYDGGRYIVLMDDLNWEHNRENLVVYTDLDYDLAVNWVKSLSNFTEVFPDGTPRFRYIGHCDIRVKNQKLFI